MRISDILRSLPRPRFYWSRNKCTCCGSHVRHRAPVMWDLLSEQWELTPELRRFMDQREGDICALCLANRRSTHLASVLLASLAMDGSPTLRKLRSIGNLPAIAEINEIPGLHRQLSGLVESSEYGSPNSQDLMALTYADESFDYVLTSDTLEHVPDFERAMSEIHRVLRRGGKHIFTIPIMWDRATRQRAELVDGEIVHRLPPSYHGSEVGDDYLVFNEFGADVIGRIERAGFAVSVTRDDGNPLVCTITAEKRETLPVIRSAEIVRADSQPEQWAVLSRDPSTGTAAAIVYAEDKSRLEFVMSLMKHDLEYAVVPRSYLEGREPNEVIAQAGGLPWVTRSHLQRDGKGANPVALERGGNATSGVLHRL